MGQRKSLNRFTCRLTIDGPQRLTSDGPQALGTIYLSWLLPRHYRLIWIVTPWVLLDHCSLYLYFCNISYISHYLVWLALFQVTTVERRLCGSNTTWQCLGLLSRPLDPHTLHILYHLYNLLQIMFIMSLLEYLGYNCACLLSNKTLILEIRVKTCPT